MPSHHETRHLPHPPEALHALVLDVVRYPEFLPWLTAARVYGVEKNGDAGAFWGDLSIGYGPIHISYTSRVRYDRKMNGDYPHPYIDANHIKGPFRHLSNIWQFENLGDAKTCVYLSLCFELDSFVLKKLLDPVLEKSARHIMRAFEERAQSLSVSKKS